MAKSYKDMTVAELKERLKNRGLPVSGVKSELIARLRGTNASSSKGGGDRVPDNVLDVQLYKRVRAEIKKRVKVWPSAYASGQLVKEYKERGGRYSNSSKNGSLDRWYREKWVNVCKKGYPACGRAQSKISDYPYCRPTVRVSNATPMTVAEIKKLHGAAKLKEMCRKKRENPRKRATL